MGTLFGTFFVGTLCDGIYIASAALTVVGSVRRRNESFWLASGLPAVLGLENVVLRALLRRPLLLHFGMCLWCALSSCMQRTIESL